MAEAAVGFLLENMAQVVKYQVNLIAGAEAALELLKTDLTSLKAFLHDAAAMSSKLEGFRDMESRIREVVYDVEDTIDSCVTQAAIAKQKSSFRRHFSSKRLSLAEEVKSLREKKVIEMVAMAKSFAASAKQGRSQEFVYSRASPVCGSVSAAKGKGSGTSNEESASKLAKVQIIREENVVGFDDKEEKIINCLLEPKQELDVISIIGMPGLGKTTLAWKIFKNESIVKREFPNRIWICVTQSPSTRDVFLNILKEFTREDMSGLSNPALVQAIQQHLKERKFLLVLDDVWTTEAWDDIRVVLSKSNNMSKVIITSRHRNVGVKASQPSEPYELPFLDDDQSWELLQYEAFGKLDECPSILKDLGECIAHKCDGLPLSIVVIGGILMDHRTKNEEIAVKDAWQKVSDDVSKVLKNDKKQRVSDIVELSYNRLPDELRDCFLYLAVFPEDYEISVWTLTRLWIAEGFIQGQSLEEIAEENLKDLITKNLVMVGKRNSKGEVKTCHIHDVIHAFCSSKASLKHQNLFQEMKLLDGAFDPPILEMDHFRRLCIHSDFDKFLAQMDRQKATHIRSLLCFNKVPTKLPSKYAPTMVDGFDLLRVLESKSIKLDQIPKRVTQLIHLRYVTLSVDTLETLSEAFSNLWNLQTIVVYTRSKSLRIKANIWKMIQLRHLKTKAVIMQVAEGNGEGCKSLQTLSRISPEICTADFFKKVPNIKRLGIQGKLAGFFKTNPLGMLNQLERLKLVNTSHDSESKGSMRFPESRNWFPQKLKMLSIEATNLDWKDMSTLAKMETLQVLKLKSNAFIGTLWEVGGGFRDLHFFLIEETNLFKWRASNDSFPNLRCLVLKKCKELKGIPESVAKRLEKLDIEHLGKSAVESAKGIHRAGFKLTIGAGCE